MSRAGKLLFPLFAAVVLAACSSSKSAPTDTTEAPSTTSSTTAAPVGPPPAVKATPVAKLDRPTALAQRSGDPSLYVTEKGGVVRAVESGMVDVNPVLDIRAQVNSDGDRGLLGLVFAPSRPILYVSFTDRSGDLKVVEYGLDNGGKADLRTQREIISVRQEQPGAPGGQLAFGADGALYIGTGDGGGQGDPAKNAQNLSVLSGKILRIRPDMPSGGLPYTIPFDNPFAKQAGARGEIWAYGLHDPAHFSFDRSDRSLWVTDRGQDRQDEIDLTPYTGRGGLNYGWPLREGLLTLDGNKPVGAVDPVFTNDRAAGCSLVGGYVYRGQSTPDLTGRYLFGDSCSGDVSVLTKRGTAWEPDKLTLKVPGLVAFGQDNNGEVYVLSQSGVVSRVDAG